MPCYASFLFRDLQFQKMFFLSSVLLWTDGVSRSFLGGPRQTLSDFCESLEIEWAEQTEKLRNKVLILHNFFYGGLLHVSNL